MTTDQDPIPPNRNPHPTRVVHCKVDAYTVYIGRPGFWGNPAPLERGAPTLERVRCLLRYVEHLRASPQHLEHVPALQGQILGCWCSPRLCHGDILAYLADNCYDRPMAELLDEVSEQLHAIEDLVSSRPVAAAQWAEQLKQHLHLWRHPTPHPTDQDAADRYEEPPCTSTSDT